MFNTRPNKKTNLDTLKDCRTKEDGIWIDDAVLKGMDKAGTLAKPRKMGAEAF